MYNRFGGRGDPRGANLSFLLRWLGLERSSARVGLRPHRDLELELPYAAAYARCLDAIDRVLGATVTSADERTGSIEAAFGLVNSERLRCSIAPLDGERTSVHVEAIYAAGMPVPERSLNVETLADTLLRV